MMVSGERNGSRADFRVVKNMVFGWRDDGFLSKEEAKEALGALRAVKANAYAVRRVRDNVEKLVFDRYEAAEKGGMV